MTIITLFLIFCMIAVMWLDVTTYRIPNWLVGGVLLAYPLAVFLSPVAVDWLDGLMALGIMFAVGFALFALNLMGGGDVKLLVAIGLWVGLSHLLEFVLLFSVLGGAFSVLIIFARQWAPLLPWKKGGALPRVLQEKAPLPYGVAISIGFLIMLWQGKLVAIQPPVF